MSNLIFILICVISLCLVFATRHKLWLTNFSGYLVLIIFNILPILHIFYNKYEFWLEFHLLVMSIISLIIIIEGIVSKKVNYKKDKFVRKYYV